jgi:hypothetical protein
VWQTKDFKLRVFGCVANKGVMGAFFASVANSGLTEFFAAFWCNGTKLEMTREKRKTQARNESASENSGFQRKTGAYGESAQLYLKLL